MPSLSYTFAEGIFVSFTFVLGVLRCPRDGGALSKRQLVGALANQHHAPVGTWDGTSDDEQVALGIGLNDLERLDRHALVAHTSRHARALQHAARCGARANGARRAGTVRLTMGTWTAAKAIARHD